MKVKTAVITAAGERQRHLPLQTLIDRDSVARPVLAILLNEILTANIEQVCLIVRPGDAEVYKDAVPEHRGLLSFVVQPEPLGYADALWRAKEFVGSEPFLHLVGDHLYVGNGKNCAAELIAVAEQEECSVSGVRATHERFLSSFGVIGGQPVPRRPGLYRVESVLEKPTPTTAEQKLIVPGLRSGHYLAFFGMHVLTPAVMDILGELARNQSQRPATLSDALALVPGKERYFGLQVSAERYDLGASYGLFTSQLALALSGQDREEVLSLLVSMLATDHLQNKVSRSA